MTDDNTHNAELKPKEDKTDATIANPPHNLERKPTFFDRLMRRKTSPAIKNNSENDPIEREEELPPLPDVSLSGYKETTRRRLLNSELAQNIRNLVPRRLQLTTEWNLVYSMEQDGISLRSLYRNNDRDNQLALMKREKRPLETGYADLIVKSMLSTSYHNEIRRPVGYVLVIKDSTNTIFGSYINENLRLMDHKRYYGNGECFLWKCETSPEQTLRFKAFVYTGINDNIIYSNSQFIAIGSSQGHNGIWIDRLLCKGVSACCETFGNEVLCGMPNSSGSATNHKELRFEIIGLEVWRIGDP